MIRRGGRVAFPLAYIEAGFLKGKRKMTNGNAM